MSLFGLRYKVAATICLKVTHSKDVLAEMEPLDWAERFSGITY